MKHNAHLPPPEPVRAFFKRWQKLSFDEVDADANLIDFSPNHEKLELTVCYGDSTELLDKHAFDVFCFSKDVEQYPGLSQESRQPQQKYEVKNLPGLFIYPALLPSRFQIALLDKLLHRDLSNGVHKTNLHLHYNIHYPLSCPSTESPLKENLLAEEATPESLIELNENSSSTNGGIEVQSLNNNQLTTSFFAASPNDKLVPKDPSIHKTISIDQMLRRKLRWMTLGGQYDWTAKVYPNQMPPPFPRDIHDMLRNLFPQIVPEAAIVNLYSPGDTLSIHRDVSEHCDQTLISISIGCDAIFIVGDEDGKNLAAIRIRSGDVLLMSGQSRFAWHGVPKIIPHTCPEGLRDWPATSDEQHQEYEQWRGWMESKRINLNVRQMK